MKSKCFSSFRIFFFPFLIRLQSEDDQMAPENLQLGRRRRRRRRSDSSGRPGGGIKEVKVPMMGSGSGSLWQDEGGAALIPKFPNNSSGVDTLPGAEFLSHFGGVEKGRVHAGVSVAAGRGLRQAPPSTPRPTNGGAAAELWLNPDDCEVATCLFVLF